MAQISVDLRQASKATVFVTNIDYNARGQRLQIDYANGTRTNYEYDAEMFRLVTLPTTQIADNVTLQDLSYTYDPIGNVTHLQDNADKQNVIYFRNQRVEPSADYEYDAIYRLIFASGREHLGQTGSQLNPPSRRTMTIRCGWVCRILAMAMRWGILPRATNMIRSEILCK